MFPKWSLGPLLETVAIRTVLSVFWPWRRHAPLDCRQCLWFWGPCWCAGPRLMLICPNCPHLGWGSDAFASSSCSPSCCSFSALGLTNVVQKWAGEGGGCGQVQRFHIPFGREGLGNETTEIHSTLGKPNASSRATGLRCCSLEIPLG